MASDKPFRAVATREAAQSTARRPEDPDRCCPLAVWIAASPYGSDSLPFDSDFASRG